ncbi:MAG: acetate kinase, partial [Gammaproteobacteria bacterium]
MKVLVLNSGSSSIKYALFDMDTQFAQITGVIERIAESGSAHKYQCRSAGGIEKKQVISLEISGHQQGLQAVFTLLSELNFIQDISDLLCIGHRVVH